MPTLEETLAVGMQHHRAGRLKLAEDMYRQVLQFDSAQPEALHLLGVLAHQVGKYAAALGYVQAAINAKNDVAKYYLSLGEAYRCMENNSAAICSFEHAVRLSPNFPEAHKSLGVALQNVGRLDDAIVSFERAIQCRAGYGEAYLGRAFVWLSQGKFVQGWQEYETWRPRPERTDGARTEPEWDGSPLAGRTLLIESEPNLDNLLQFIRYVRVLEQQQQARVVVEVHPSLIGLLSQSGYSNLVPQGESPPRCDLRTSLLRLPHLCGTTLENVPAPIPYLSVRPELVDYWRRDLSSPGGFKVGIHWQGQPPSALAPWRSVGMASAEPLARLPGVELVSLREGFGAEQVLGVDHEFHVLDFVERLNCRDGAIVNTAAVMSAVDLVIASDTAAAHLAGALGLNVWVALPYSANWRWMIDRTDSPWYPTMRLFRQSKPAAWSDVFQEIAAELANLLKRAPHEP